MLPLDAITEYKAIYKKLYGVVLSDEEATLRANNLVNLYKAVYEQASFCVSDDEEKAPQDTLS